MNSAQVRAKARMAMKRREEQVHDEEMESGELNLVPYLDIVTNVVMFLLATVTAGFILGNVNTSLPEYAAASGAVNQPAADAEPPIQLVVAITKPDLRIFSISGMEGTNAQPKVSIAARKPGTDYDYAKLTEAALEIVKRRWPDKKRPDGSTEVIVMADPEIPYHVVVATMDAMRQAADGTKLFPDVLFSTGIQ